MNASAAALELLAQLADKVRRTVAATAVARAVGCDAFYILVLDTTVDAFVPAPGFVQTLPSAAWRTVLDCCRTPGAHRIEVVHAGTTRAATVRCDGNAGLVFVGDIVDADIVDALALALASHWSGVPQRASRDGGCRPAPRGARRRPPRASC